MDQDIMDIEAIITQMVILFLLVVAGFVSHKVKIMGGEFDRKLSSLVIQVTCPCIILASTMGERMPDRNCILPLLAVGAMTYVILIGAGFVIPHIMPVKRDERGIYGFMLAYANVGFIGYPIIASIFGSDAVFYACILNVPNTLTIFVFGIMFVTGQKAGTFDWKLLYSPAMLSTYLSIVIVASGWHAPRVVSEPLTLLGNMTVPAALLIIGSSIAAMPARQMTGNRGTYSLALMRLLFLPLTVLAVMRLIGVDERIAGINTILAGMPVASYGTMFCLKYGRDETVMSQGTFLTTLLSVLSIPLLVMIIHGHLF